MIDHRIALSRLDEPTPSYLVAEALWLGRLDTLQQAKTVLNEDLSQSEQVMRLIEMLR